MEDNILKETALEFAKWLHTRRLSHRKFSLLFPTEELYNEFIKQKNKSNLNDEKNFSSNSD